MPTLPVYGVPEDATDKGFTNDGRCSGPSAVASSMCVRSSSAERVHVSCLGRSPRSVSSKESQLVSNQLETSELSFSILSALEATGLLSASNESLAHIKDVSSMLGEALELLRMRHQEESAAKVEMLAASKAPTVESMQTVRSTSQPSRASSAPAAGPNPELPPLHIFIRTSLNEGIDALEDRLKHALRQQCDLWEAQILQCICTECAKQASMDELSTKFTEHTCILRLPQSPRCAAAESKNSEAATVHVELLQSLSSRLDELNTKLDEHMSSCLIPPEYKGGVARHSEYYSAAECVEVTPEKPLQVTREAPLEGNPEHVDIISNSTFALAAEREPPITHASGITGKPSGMTALVSKTSDSDGTSAEVIYAMIIRQQMAELDGEGSRSMLTRKMLENMLTVAQWWEALSEPTRSGCLYSVVKSRTFTSFSFCMILANTVLAAYIADWEMKNPGSKTSADSAMLVIQSAFVSYYIMELVAKLMVHRLYFFVNYDMKWNCLDFVVVAASASDLLLQAVSDTKLTSESIVFVRVFRIVRSVKTFRVFRALRFFNQLHAVMNGLQQSMVTLFWVFIVLLIMIYVFALVLLQGISDFMATYGDSLSAHDRNFILSHFGSMSQAMLSLYAAVTGGSDWYTGYQVVERAGLFYAFIYLFFTFFFTFALFNMLTGVFVEKALAASTPQRADLALQQRRKARADAREFSVVCNILDPDNTGSITWKDFKRHMHNEAMVAYLASIGLEIHEVELFFHIVAGDAHEGRVNIERFAHGCLQMKGEATAMDVQKLLFEFHLLDVGVHRFEQNVNVHFSRLEEIIAARFSGQAMNWQQFRPNAATETAAIKL